MRDDARSNPMNDSRQLGAPRDSRTLLREAVARLECVGISGAKLDAEVILAEALGLARIQILTSSYEVGEEQALRFGQMIGLRATRMPLAYILGHREFFSIELKVNHDVLIPRPETETLVSAALDFIGEREGLRILDLGTGSGAIALALTLHTPSARIVATDISPAALVVARANAERLGVSSPIEFVLADCWHRSDDLNLDQFDLIVSNPPYIAERDMHGLEPEVREYEPRLALTPGADGLAFYRRIAAGLSGHLSPQGFRNA